METQFHLRGKVLVTGASGFLASHIIPTLLEAGNRVVGVDRRKCRLPKHRNFTFLQKNISGLGALRGVDYVIHLACATNIPKSIQDPVATTHDNIQLGVKMLELARQAGVKKFLFPSTASLYGSQPTPWKEDLRAFPNEPYSLQKYTMEKFCEYYARNGLPTVIFRFFQVFGENQRRDTALAKFLRCRRENKPIPITRTTAQAGFQSARRDFIYAGDIAKACLAALESVRAGNGEIINIASGYTYTIQEIAELISDKIEFIPKRAFETDEHWADISRAKELLNWKPQTDIKDWLRQTVTRS